MAQSLAVKYRPSTWDDVCGQSATKQIIQHQLASGDWRQAVLFVGPAGCGKTTCARIFANEINKGQGNPIELDAASNNSVEDIRRIGQQAKTKSLDSEYKVFIIDECHALSSSAWQAMLKLIEEPPAKSVFILCTTESQKIPKTILSRCQRFDFQRMDVDTIKSRLQFICESEGIKAVDKSLDYIARLADGGMRDSITLLDKCLVYTPDLEFFKVVEVLGVIDYSILISIINSVTEKQHATLVDIIEQQYRAGVDIKQMVKSLMLFLLDIKKYSVGCEWKQLQIPDLPEYVEWLDSFGDYEYEVCSILLDVVVRLNADIKYSATPKYDLEAALLLIKVN